MEPKQQNRNYEPPTVTVLGTVEDLTAGADGDMTDGLALVRLSLPL